MLLLLLMLFFSVGFNFNFLPYSPKTTLVTIHLDRFNEQFNLFHIGISFDDTSRRVRFDYRSHYNNYNTYDYNHSSLGFILDHPELIDNNNKNIIWGNTNKTIDEVLAFEKSLQKKYILGIYDCRHYVSKFTRWSLDKPTPIWNLHKIWDQL